MPNLFIFNLINLKSCTISQINGGQDTHPIRKFTLCGTGILHFLALLAILLPGCSRKATDVQLTQWRTDAIARNHAIVAQRSKNSKPLEWELFINGQVAKGPQRLGWERLEAIATTRISTTSPHNSKNPKAILYFRGIKVSQLLDRFGAKPDAANVTFLGYDGFRSTVNITDLRRYPIILAVERDGRRISRSEGGPLSLVFPQSEYPQLQKEYADRFWAFYITHAIVGNESPQIRIGNRILDSKTLDKLPQITIEESVGYGQGWPIGKVKLHGVRVRDVLNLAKVAIAKNGAVIVKGKSAVSRDRNNPIRLRSADIRDCDILLVTRWGEGSQPIPTQLGGPVTLAVPASCNASNPIKTPIDNSDRPWITFVEELDVE